MTKAETLRFHNILLERLGDIRERVHRIESGRRDLGERAVEVEEEAQKFSIIEANDELNGKARDELEQIDLALRKIGAGEYGICESCGDDISLKRLEALPWARLCVDCARDYEHKHQSLPDVLEPSRSRGVPEEYEGLSDQQVLDMIYEYFRDESGLDMDGVKITLRNGTLYLDGTLQDESEREEIVQVIGGVMGFSSVVERLKINDRDWVGDAPAPGLSLAAGAR